MAMTGEQFVEYLKARRAAKESLKKIADSLGVTHVAVHRWLQGHKASDTVLLLAEQLQSNSDILTSH